MAHWVVIRTDRFKESYIKLQLDETTDAEAYLPMVKVARNNLRKAAAKLEPLFPGYLFARFDLTTQLLQLRRLHGFKSLVSFDGRPAWVDEAVIYDLRRREKRTGYIALPAAKPPLLVHRRVHVTEGPFSGQTGMFLRYLDGAQRVCILLDLLQSGVRLELPREAVTPVRSVNVGSARKSSPPAMVAL